MTLAIVTPAASDPVTLAEAKAHCRVDFTTDDTYIGTLISAAVNWVESKTGRQLMSVTLRQSWDNSGVSMRPDDIALGRVLVSQHVNSWRGGSNGFQTAEMQLAREPVSAVSWVKYYDNDDVQQTVSSSDYWVDIDSTPPRVTPKTAWPSVHWLRPNAFQIQFVAGYADATSVPALLKHAIKVMVAHWYEIREPVIQGVIIADVPMSAKHICETYQTKVIK